MNKDTIYAGILWIVLTIVGFIIVSQVNIFPLAAAEEAEIVDEAFQMLLLLSVPVATVVLTVLIYSFIRFRVRDGDTTRESSLSFRTNQPIAIGWFAITTALAVFVVFNPGLKGMNELSANPNADLIVQIEGEQWHWNVTYPQYDLSYQRALQIAVPVDTRVQFEFTSKDVIHSFWIPAFRLKEDAVPGRTTTMFVTPTETGTFAEDVNLRVQCAELCGTGHPRMQMEVKVLEPQEFESWVEAAKSAVESN